MKIEVDITKEEKLIAYCGLYCGACPRFIKEKGQSKFINHMAENKFVSIKK